MVELRIPSEANRAELNAIDRGARDPDLDRLPRSHQRSRAALIEESFTFLVLTDQAAVPLTAGGKKGWPTAS